MSQLAVEVQGLSKRFRLHRDRHSLTVKDLFVRGLSGRGIGWTGDDFWALRDLSFTIPAGKMVGLIGANGSGKSTLLKCVAGILKPTAGRVKAHGRVSALIELGAGFHPEFTGRENVLVNGIILGLSRREVRERFDDIVRFAGLEAFIDSPVKTYSSGMYMRLGFAIAVSVEPEILLIDEILAVGDEAFQHKCVNKIHEFKAAGKTILFVSHDMGAVARLCDEALWLHRGHLRLHGQTREVIDGYLAEVGEAEASSLAEANREAEVQAKSATSQRWGSREVEISSVQFFDAAGRERYLFESGEEITVKLGWRAARRVEDPVFGIGIFRRDGVYCYGTNTAIEELSLPAVEGAGSLQIVFEQADLVAGDYLLDVAVHHREGAPYDYHSHLYAFSIRSKVREEGVARLRHRWVLDSGSKGEPV